MTRLLALCLCFLLQIPSYGLDTNFTCIKINDGVILCSKEEISGNTQAVKIQIISNRIGRVTTSQQTLSANSGLIYIYVHDVSSRPIWNILSSCQGKPTLKAQFLKVITDVSAGTVPFLISKKNYGLLRDIYESALNLTKKEGIRISNNVEKQIVHLK